MDFRYHPEPTLRVPYLHSVLWGEVRYLAAQDLNEIDRAVKSFWKKFLHRSLPGLAQKTQEKREAVGLAQPSLSCTKREPKEQREQSWKAEHNPS